MMTSFLFIQTVIDLILIREGKCDTTEVEKRKCRERFNLFITLLLEVELKKNGCSMSFATWID